MRTGHVHKGFSLVEVLLAAAMLAVGFVIIVGLFPVGIRLAGLAMERTVAVVATDEALAKIRLYAADPDCPPSPDAVFFTIPTDPTADIVGPVKTTADAVKFFNNDPQVKALLVSDIYPSTSVSPDTRRYIWTALLKHTDPNDLLQVQAIIFVSTKRGAAVQYPNPADPLATTLDWPVPVQIPILTNPSTGNIWWIDISVADAKSVIAGSVLVDDKSGRLMTVLECKSDSSKTRLFFTTQVDGSKLGTTFWVVPPAVGSSTYPCLMVTPYILRY